MVEHAVNCNISEKLSDVCSCGASPTQGEKPSFASCSAKATQDKARREWIARRLFETWPPDPPLVSWDEAASKDFWRERADEYLDMERRVIASPQEGEKPAEARAALAEALRKRADWLRDERLHGGDFQHLLAREGECRWLSEQAGRGTGPFAALSSPQEGATADIDDDVTGLIQETAWEGATAVGAMDLHANCIAQWRADNARIEALQGQVAEAEDWRNAWREAHEALLREIEHSSKAESSLRTLGNALERARDAWKPFDAITAEDFSDDLRLFADAVPTYGDLRRMKAALTPPTRDTSCEASSFAKASEDGLAKQEPATPVSLDVEEAAAAAWKEGYRAAKIVDQIIRDDIATPASPSDKGADE